MKSLRPIDRINAVSLRRKYSKEKTWINKHCIPLWARRLLIGEFESYADSRVSQFAEKLNKMAYNHESFANSIANDATLEVLIDQALKDPKSKDGS